MRRSSHALRIGLAWTLLVGWACGEAVVAPDATSDAGALADAGLVDAAIERDAGETIDAGATDALFDAGDFEDASAMDAGEISDAEMPDADGGEMPPVDSGVDAGPWQLPSRATCAGSYGPPVTTQGVTDNEIREASGLIASPINPDVLWTHNDSGDDPRLFALRSDGTALGRLTLANAVRGDWEDAAAGPCPDGSGPCLWVEDRSSQKVYAIVEPIVSSTQPFGDTSTSDFWSYAIDYPSGLRPDVEALLVEPDGSAFYTIEKTSGARARIYSAAPPTTRTATLSMTEVGSFSSPTALGGNITGGDLHPSRTRLVLRTYLGIYEYRLHPGDFPADLDAADRFDYTVSVTLEPSGESVTYDHSGEGLFTLSEGFLQAPGQPVNHYDCQ